MNDTPRADGPACLGGCHDWVAVQGLTRLFLPVYRCAKCGHWRFRCGRCANGMMRDPDEPCPSCDGRGWLVRPAFVPIRAVVSR